MKTPFKLKSSPAKGKLGDFFKGASAKIAAGTEARLTKQIQENQGITNFEKRQADKAAERKSGGKSKFQRAGAERKANKAATAEGNARNAADKASREANAVKVETIVPATPEKVVKKTTPPKGKLQSQTRKDEYDAKGWAYDDTIKGYNRDASRKNFTVQTSVKPNKEGVMTPQTAQFNTKEESDAYIAKNKGSFGYKTDKDGKRIMKPSKKKQNNNKTNVATNNANSTQTKTKKKPNILANIMKPGFMHFIK